MPFDIGGFVYDSTFIQDYGKSGIITDGLVLYLDAGFAESYPKGGTTWYDLSGNSNHGTLTNGPTYSSVNGGGIVFDGSNDYVSAPTSNFATLNKFTAMVWTKSATSTWNSTGSILSKREQFIIHNNQGTTTINYYVRLSGGWSYVAYTHSNITSWNLYTMTYNAGSIKIYLNGSLVTSGTVGSPILSDTGNVFIGWDDGISGRYYAGNTGTVLLYTKDLSSTEITQNYNATKGRFGL